MAEAGAAILAIIDACLRGEEPAVGALRELVRRSDLPEPLAFAVHELHHFDDDRDIRIEDREYASFWNEKLAAIRLRVIQS